MYLSGKQSMNHHQVKAASRAFMDICDLNLFLCIASLISLPLPKYIGLPKARTPFLRYRETEDCEASKSLSHSCVKYGLGEMFFRDKVTLLLLL